MNTIKAAYSKVIGWTLLFVAVGLSQCQTREKEKRQWATQPQQLTVELLSPPLNTPILNPQPVFGWAVVGSDSAYQAGEYELIVASTKAKAEARQGDMWQLRQRVPHATQNLEYKGKPLASNSTYYWCVRQSNDQGEFSSFSEVQSFRTGSLDSAYHTEKHALVQNAYPALRRIEKKDGSVFFDFGKAAFGTLTLTATMDKAAELTIELGEKLSAKATLDTNPPGTVRYRKQRLKAKNGTHKYRVQIEPDKYNTGSWAVRLPDSIGEVLPFRYARISGPASMELSAVQQLRTQYPFEASASDFQSSDSLLNRVWAFCKYSIQATTFAGIYVDGDRERIPYEADAYINQLGHYAVDHEYALARYTHEYLLNHATWPTEWQLHSVMMAYQDYMYTGNLVSLRQHYPMLQKKTLRMLEDTNHLITTKKELPADSVLGKIYSRRLEDIVDWPPAERDEYELGTYNAVPNAFYVYGLRLMSEIARALDKPQDVARYQAAYQASLKAFDAHFYDPKQGLYTDNAQSSHASLHANMFPLAFGLVPDSRKPTIGKYLASKGMACSVYGAQYLLEALFEAQKPTEAIELMNDSSDRSWLGMLKAGSTITMEAWGKEYKPNLDWNHAWGAAPANIIPRGVFGIRPLEPGFTKVAIKPQLGTIRHAKIKHPTIRGPIQVECRKEGLDSLLSMRVELPLTVKGKVYFPTRFFAVKISMNGKQITPKLEEGFYTQEIGSGTYRFELTRVDPGPNFMK